MRAARALAEGWLGLCVACVIATAAVQPLHAQTITAADDAYATEPAVALTAPSADGVLVNDAGGAEDDYAAVLVATTANGALLLDANGGFFYLPNLGFAGEDAFTYRVTDGVTESNVATVTITVATVGGNVAPVAVADSYAGAEDTELDVNPANGVLANDTDTEPGPLTAVLLSTTGEGTLIFNSNGSFRYTPAAGFVGNDQFQYRARDSGGALSAPVTVTIGVNDVNDAPVATADSYSTNENQPLNVAAAAGVLDNDTDPDGDTLTAVLVTAPASGTLTLQSTGAFLFTPAAGANGAVTFTYQADDGTVRSNTATVTITVNAVNDPPAATADTYTTAEETALTVAAATGVLANDTDPDTGTTLTAALIGAVTNGTLALQPTGAFTYTPAANFSGAATFTYQARDGSASSATTTVTINVGAVNDAPFITNAPPTTATEGTTYRYTLTAADPDGNAVQITAPTLPSWLRFTAPASLSGTPGQADAGEHDVTMQVTDGIAAPIVLRFQITVQSVDNAPTITAIPEQSGTEGAPLDVDLAPFVTDADTPAGGLSYAATGGVPEGLALGSTGRLTGTPSLGTSVGQHTVRFTVADATSRVPAELRLTILPAGRVDLAVTLSAAPSPAALDAVATWTIAVTNRAANVEARGASLEASFTGDVPFMFDPPATLGCTATPSGNQTVVACALGPLAGGATATIALTGRGNFAGDIFGRATVTATGGGTGGIDEVPGNDSATASLSIAQRVSSAPEQRIAGVSARAIVAADFNGDGFDDLAVATLSPQGVLLLPNIVDPTNSARRMLTPTPQSLGGEALGTDLAAADLDRDGDLDLVLAAAAGAPDRVFLAASGSFAMATLGASFDSRAVTVGDVNGDGFTDLVFANPGGSSLLLNSGSAGVFTRGPRLGTGDARDVLLVDLIGDGLPELVIANGNGDATVYANDRGTFTLARTLATGPTSAVASGDFNADGRADLVFGRETAAPPGMPTTRVWLNEAGTGQFFVSDELGAATTSGVLAKDLDLDGRADVLASSSAGQRIFTNAGAANGTFVLHAQQLATPGARGAAVGRFSNDDRIDLAVAGDGIAVFVNDGRGNFGSGDSTPPTLALRGQPTVDITIDTPFTDPGATATDTVDGDLSSRIVTSGAVNTALLGSYTLTYSVTDLSGNAATPVTRTVNVRAQAAAEEGGGGGATGPGLVLALLLAPWLARLRRPRGTR